MEGDGAPTPETSPEEDLAMELAVLRAIVGVSKVSAHPAGRTDLKFNNNKVKIVYEKPDGDRVNLEVKCSQLLPTKLHAAREAKQQLAELLGSEAIEKAEEAILTKLGGSTVSTSFFARSREAQQKQKQQAELKEQVKQAKQRLAEAAAIELAAAQAREAAATELQRLQSALEELTVDQVRRALQPRTARPRAPLHRSAPGFFMHVRIVLEENAGPSPNPASVRARDAENESIDDRSAVCSQVRCNAPTRSPLVLGRPWTDFDRVWSVLRVSSAPRM